MMSEVFESKEGSGWKALSNDGTGWFEKSWLTHEEWW